MLRGFMANRSAQNGEVFCMSAAKRKESLARNRQRFQFPKDALGSRSATFIAI